MAGALYLCTCYYFVIRFLQRRVQLIREWVTPNPKVAMIASALLVPITVMWREPFDAQRDPAPKSVLDLLVWLIWGLLSAYAIYRIRYMD
jgi:hypothetical protein